MADASSDVAGFISDKTVTAIQQTWVNGKWINLSDTNQRNNMQKSIDNLSGLDKTVAALPHNYYSPDQPTGTSYNNTDRWYKTSTDSDGTIKYTPYKWDSTTSSWKPMLDQSAIHSFVGSAPASPVEGDFWMDNTTLKQYQSGNWEIVPTKGDQGIPGVPGSDGKTYYTWIKYATDSNGSNMSNSPTGMSYMGLAYNKESETESSTATDYTWSLIKGADGADGIPGKAGADGKTSYFHIAYANSSDGSIGFTTSPNISSSYSYIGTYTDYTSTSSTNYSSYTWVAMFDSTKKRNFTTQPTTPYAVGDTWTQSGATYFCTTARNSGAFTASDWTMQQLTIQSLDSSVTNSLYNDNRVIGTGQDTVIDDTANTGTQGWRFRVFNLTQQPKVGDQITVSAEGMLTGRGDLSTYEAILYDSYTTVGRSDSKRLTAGKRSSATLEVTNLNGTGDTVLLIYAGNITDTEGKKNVIHHLKVNFGSVATPWCLSQSEITTTTGNYKGVTLNDAGLTATAGSTTVAMNSTDGFLINNASGQVFHADTAGNLTMQGDITAGNISGVNFLGDNLTLAGILAVTGELSASSGNTVINSNGLTIRGGNLSLQDASGNQTTHLESDGTFVTNKGVFSGTITGSHFLAGNTYTSLLNSLTRYNVTLDTSGMQTGDVYASDLDYTDYVTVGSLTKSTTNTANTSMIATADVTSPTLFTIDGSKLNAGDRVLVKLDINYSNYEGKLGSLIALQSASSSPITFNSQSLTTGYYTYSFIITWSAALGTGKANFQLKSTGLQANSNFYVVGANFYTDHGTGTTNYYETSGGLDADGSIRLKDYYSSTNQDAINKIYHGYEWDRGVLRLSEYNYDYDIGSSNPTITAPYSETQLSGSGIRFLSASNDPVLEFFGDIGHESLISALDSEHSGVEYTGARNLANGIYFDQYGNVCGYPNSGSWCIISSHGEKTLVAEFPLNKKGDIQLNPPSGYGLNVNGTINGFTMQANNIKAASGDGFYLDNAGGYGGNADLHVKSVTQSSLLSLKTNITEIDSGTALDLINQTGIYDYQFKDDVSNNITKHYASYIIDDVNDTPQYKEPEEFLSRDKKGRDDGSLLSYTVLAIQELSKQVDTLKSQLAIK